MLSQSNNQRFRLLLVTIIGLSFFTFVGNILVSHAILLDSIPMTSLEHLLNSAGTLDMESGFRGSVDIDGWIMTTTTTGQPRFSLPQASNDAGVWDGRFYPPGVSGNVCTDGCTAVVRAIAVDGSDVYMGGDFAVAGDVKANYIAKWDGQNWHALGEGFNGVVQTIAVNGDDVYAGGQFTMSGGTPMNHIARWDGSNWSALQNGLNGSVSAIAVNAQDVFVSGGFTAAGGDPVNHIARWDGSQWHTLGSGLDGTAFALLFIGDDLYAGGSFTTAGGLMVNKIARWDGANWSGLGGGVSGGANGGNIYALTSDGSNLFVGGDFASAGGLNVFGVARWNGQDWFALGPGMNLGGTVYALVMHGGDLYAGGSWLDNDDLPTAYNFVKWDGSNWSVPTNGKLSSNVYVMAVTGSNLYAGGGITFAEPNTWVAGIARWDGQNWSALDVRGLGLVGGPVNALAVTDQYVYAAGDTLGYSGQARSGTIAQWDGAQWISLPFDIIGGLQEVFALAVMGDDLYVGGSFTDIDGLTVNNIARWDGQNWSALGSGTSFFGNGYGGYVTAIFVAGSDLYVGGMFDAVDGVSIPANGIARWDSIQWHALGDGVTSSASPIADIGAIVMDSDDLYVGGTFDTAGSVNANNVAKWDGSSWSALGDGVIRSDTSFYHNVGDHDVNTLAVYGSDLYAGGSFDTADGLQSNYIAKWDGFDWSALGNGMDDFVYDLVVHDNLLYVGGAFRQADGVIVKRIATWDGANWGAFGGGVNDFDVRKPVVRAIGVRGSDLFIGGRFIEVGDKPAFNFSIWHGFTLHHYVPIVLNQN